MPYDLDPSEVLAYSNQRRSAMANWGQQTAQNDYQQQASERQYGTNLQRMGTRWNRTRASLPGAAIRRNMLTSGIYGRRLGEYEQDRNSEFGQLATDYWNQRAQQGFQQQNANQQYQNSMLDIEDRERLRRAQIASQLMGVPQ